MKKKESDLHRITCFDLFSFLGCILGMERHGLMNKPVYVQWNEEDTFEGVGNMFSSFGDREWGGKGGYK